MRLLLLLVLLVNLFLLSSCKKYKEANAAFFIKAGKISVAPSSVQVQGSASHKITDLWLYVNGKFQGVYPVGNLMPIVSNGNKVSINVFAGIKNNGISDTRIFWPMYEFLTIDTLVETGKTIERDFTFKYKSSTTFTLIEGFDGNGSFFEKSAISDPSFTNKINSGDDGFEGNYFELTLPTTLDYDYIGRVESSGPGFSLPTSSSNVYLEFNYKSNVGFNVGIITNEGVSRSASGINPQENWNKIYIQLSNVINENPVSTKCKIYFDFVKLKNVTEVKKVLLDNIKLVYLP